MLSSQPRLQQEVSTVVLRVNQSTRQKSCSDHISYNFLAKKVICHQSFLLVSELCVTAGLSLQSSTSLQVGMTLLLSHGAVTILRTAMIWYLLCHWFQVPISISNLILYEAQLHIAWLPPLAGAAGVLVKVFCRCGSQLREVAALRRYNCIISCILAATHYTTLDTCDTSTQRLQMCRYLDLVALSLCDMFCSLFSNIIIMTKLWHM